MRKKLNSILLVDDDKDCIFFHQRLLTKMDCVTRIYTTYDGKEAIDFLTDSARKNEPKIDIVFLDVNMPRMNGWEFLEEYGKLDEMRKARVLIIMLTTALNSADAEKLKLSKDINGYKNKYLDKEAITQIVEEYFPDYV